MTAVGSSRRLTHRTFTPDGAAADASSVVLTVTDPAGATATPSLDNPETGLYTAQVSFSLPGLWQWSWLSSGGDATARAESGATLAGGSRAVPPHTWCSLEDAARVPAIRELRDGGRLDYGQLERECQAATEFLHTRTWRRFRGLAQIELRPCCSCAWSRSPLSMYGWYAFPTWPVVTAAASRGDSLPIVDGIASCGCHINREVLLPDDTRAVLSVTLDGVLFTDWRFDAGKRLVRTDGQLWPCCNSVEDPIDTQGVMSVQVVIGEEEYAMARGAAAELAAELYLSIADPSKCRIPARVTTVQRQGATYTRVDTSTLAKDGFLGLRYTDIFLSAFGARRRRLSIASPDVPEIARHVGTMPS